MGDRRLLERLRRGHVHNVSFADFCRLVEAFGFRRVRTAGSHRLFEHPAVPEILNLQPDGSDAKAYQVRQFLGQVRRYNLHLEDTR